MHWGGVRGLALIGFVALSGACSRGAEPEPPPVAEPATRRVLDSGPVVGFEATAEADAWLGIPYARPPRGDLRWRAPRPPEPWTAEREALEPGPPCMQFANPLAGDGAEPGTIIGGADCLYLNVWAPRSAAPKRPVMVWIHGGGNTIGEGGSYDGSQLAGRHDLVVLTVNYRLGALGWFHHPVLAAGEEPADASGNYGTLDLIRVLTWVRDNIAAFGGDPQNVTIFGESAGGRNVLSLLISPAARGLFQRAIVQSGSLRTTTLYEAAAFADSARPGHEASSGEILLRLLVADGRAADRESARAVLAKMSAEETAAYLRGKDAAALLRAYGPGFAGMYSHPDLFRDGHVILDGEPVARLARGDYAKVPVILGSNRDESKLFMFGSDELVFRLFGIPLWVRDPRMYELLAEYQSKAWKVRGVDSLADIMSAVQGPTVFAYRWDWDEEPTILFADLSLMLGAAHGLEIPFVFGHWQLGPANRLFTEENRPGREALSAAMMSYWAQFAHTGRPGQGRRGELPAWTPWNNASPSKFMVLDTEADGGLRMSGDALHGPLVILQIDSDRRLPSQRDKCEVFRALVLWSDLVPEEKYRTVGERGCRAYPLDEYPWPE